MRLINVLACTAIGLGTIDFVCYYVSGDVFGESSLYTFSAGLEGFVRLDEREGARIDGIVTGVGMSDSRFLVAQNTFGKALDLATIAC